MNGATPLPNRAWAFRVTPQLLWGIAVGIGVALPLGLILSRVTPPLGLEIAAGAAFLAVVTLAVVRLDAAVVLGFAMLGVVLVEPAPVDLVFLVIIAVTLATGRFHARVPPVVLGALWALLALNLLSAVEVVDPGRAAFFLATTTYLVLFALWLTGYVASLERARLVVVGYLLAAVSSTALGMLALFVAVPGADLLVGSGRVQAFFQDPNVFGPFLVPIALILVEDLLTPRLLGFRRFVKASLVLLLVLGVVFSFSRGAWVNLTVGAATVLVVLGLRRGGGRQALLVVLLVLVLAGSVTAILAASGSESFLLERARIQSYDADRFSAQVVGIESAERYPFGVGPGQFEHYAPISAHSTYVRVVGEQGLPGLLALLVILTSTLVAALRNAAAGRETYGIGSAALLGAWCGILVNSVVVDTLHWRHLWIVAALIWAGWARRRLLRPRREVRTREARA
jgi:O-antigen ligase